MRFRYILTGFALSLALAACGGGDDNGDPVELSEED